MTIQSRYDPLKVSEITREKIEARNNKTIPTVNRVGVQLQGSRNAPKDTFRPNDDSLKNDFFNMLMTPATANSTSTPNKSNQSDFDATTHGTNEFFSPQNKCEEREKILPNSDFNFSIVNSMAGEVHIRGEFINGKCLVRLTMKSNLSLKEKSVLAQMLRASLESKLNTELELKID